MLSEAQRNLKKARILFSVIAVFVVIAAIIFWPKPQPCFNGVKDATEEGVDCGGLCAKACPVREIPEYERKVKVDFARAVADGKDTYDLVADVKNQNELWGVSRVDYKFKVWGTDGELIKEIPGSTYLMPAGNLVDHPQGLSNYILENNVNLTEKPERVELEFANFTWKRYEDPAELSDIRAGIITVKNVWQGFNRNLQAYVVHGETFNHSKYYFRKVDIAAVVIDRNGEVVAVGKTDQLTMRSGDGWGFDIMWPNLDPQLAEEGRVNFSVVTNVFDTQNYVKDYKVE